jgi:thiol-disulfide isomerase/thioredoxin
MVKKHYFCNLSRIPFTMKIIKMPKLITAFALLVILSCSKTEENVPLIVPTAQITVEKIVREASLRNQVIPFSVLNEMGDDVTATTTFYVDGEEITGNAFSSPIVGEFEVYGSYNENGVIVTTNTVPFKVIIPKRKIVVEDYTGTWCGYCPSVAHAVEEAHAATNDIAVVAIHKTASSVPDPMHFDDVQLLQDEFGVSGFPAARINRSTVWSSPYDVDGIVSMAGVETDLAIAILSELDGNTLTVRADVVYENGSVNGDKIVVYLLESGIIHEQINYYNTDATSVFYQQGNPILDFVHNDALRLSLTEVLGDNISATAELDEFTKVFTVAIPTAVVDIANLSLVAMVVSADNTAKNAQYAHINEDKAYE